MSVNDKQPPEYRPSGHLIRLPEAAAITGLPISLLRKSFMSEDKRPANVPLPSTAQTHRPRHLYPRQPT